MQGYRLGSRYLKQIKTDTELPGRANRVRSAWTKQAVRFDRTAASLPTARASRERSTPVATRPCRARYKVFRPLPHAMSSARPLRGKRSQKCTRSALGSVGAYFRPYPSGEKISALGKEDMESETTCPLGTGRRPPKTPTMR